MAQCSVVHFVAQCNVQWFSSPMFSGGILYALTLLYIVEQCQTLRSVHWRGSPPVSWWRHPAVSGRLLRKAGTQYYQRKEQKRIVQVEER